MNPLFTDWLHRVDTAAAGLPADRRADLVDDLAEHLTAADARGLDESGARAVLDRLGTPEQVVAAAWQEVREPDADTRPADPWATAVAGTVPAAAVTSRQGISAELWTLACLLGGAVLAWAFFPLGLLGLVGVGLLWVAGRWTRRERVIGTVLGVVVPVLLVVTALVVVRRGDGSACFPSGSDCGNLGTLQSEHTAGLGTWELLLLLTMAPMVSAVCWLATSLYLGLRPRHR